MRLVLLSLLAAYLLTAAACTPKSEEDQLIADLGTPKRRSSALLKLGKLRSKKAVPEVLEILRNRYKPMTDPIRTLGLIGDTVAVPELIAVVDAYFKKNSPDTDRVVEEAAIALGRIGDPQAKEKLIEVLASPVSGELGRAGAIQALGNLKLSESERDIVADALIERVNNERENITLKHFAMGSLIRLNVPKARDLYAKAMFIDGPGGLNLFRDAKEAFCTLNDDAAVDGLLQTAQGKNQPVEDFTNTLVAKGFKKVFVQIKALDVLGMLRSPRATEYLSGIINDPKQPIEVFGKAVQAAERIADPATGGRVIVEWLKKNGKTNDFTRVGEVELVTNGLLNMGDAALVTDVLWAQFERGDMLAKIPTAQAPKGEERRLPQICWSAANVISTLARGDALPRFREIAAKNKCIGTIDERRGTTAAKLIPEFVQRLEAVQACGEDAACYERNVRDDKQPWAVRDRSVREIARLKPENAPDILLAALGAEVPQLRFAAVNALHKVTLSATDYVRLHNFWKADSDKQYQENLELQKATEELGYVLALKRRALGDWVALERDGEAAVAAAAP